MRLLEHLGELQQHRLHRGPTGLGGRILGAGEGERGRGQTDGVQRMAWPKISVNPTPCVIQIMSPVTLKRQHSKSTPLACPHLQSREVDGVSRLAEEGRRLPERRHRRRDPREDVAEEPTLMGGLRLRSGIAAEDDA